MVDEVKPFRHGSQRHRLLTVFFSGERLTRFQAETYGAHALNSLIADFERLGLVFHRHTVTLPTRWDAGVRVAQYWLAAESYDLAARFLGIERNRAPIAPENDALLYRKASRG